MVKRFRDGWTDPGHDNNRLMYPFWDLDYDVNYEYGTSCGRRRCHGGNPYGMHLEYQNATVICNPSGDSSNQPKAVLTFNGSGFAHKVNDAYPNAEIVVTYLDDSVPGSIVMQDVLKGQGFDKTLAAYSQNIRFELQKTDRMPSFMYVQVEMRMKEEHLSTRPLAGRIGIDWTTCVTESATQKCAFTISFVEADDLSRDLRLSLDLANTYDTAAFPTIDLEASLTEDDFDSAKVLLKLKSDPDTLFATKKTINVSSMAVEYDLVFADSNNSPIVGPETIYLRALATSPTGFCKDNNNIPAYKMKPGYLASPPAIIPQCPFSMTTGSVNASTASSELQLSFTFDQGYDGTAFPNILLEVSRAPVTSPSFDAERLAFQYINDTSDTPTLSKLLQQQSLTTVDLNFFDPSDLTTNLVGPLTLYFRALARGGSNAATDFCTDLTNAPAYKSATGSLASPPPPDPPESDDCTFAISVLPDPDPIQASKVLEVSFDFASSYDTSKFTQVTLEASFDEAFEDKVLIENVDAAQDTPEIKKTFPQSGLESLNLRFFSRERRNPIEGPNKLYFRALAETSDSVACATADGANAYKEAEGDLPSPIPLECPFAIEVAKASDATASEELQVTFTFEAAYNDDAFPRVSLEASRSSSQFDSEKVYLRIKNDATAPQDTRFFDKDSLTAPVVVSFWEPDGQTRITGPVQLYFRALATNGDSSFNCTNAANEPFYKTGSGALEPDGDPICDSVQIAVVEVDGGTNPSAEERNKFKANVSFHGFLGTPSSLRVTRGVTISATYGPGYSEQAYLARPNTKGVFDYTTTPPETTLFHTFSTEGQEIDSYEFGVAVLDSGSVLGGQVYRPINDTEAIRFTFSIDGCADPKTFDLTYDGGCNALLELDTGGTANAIERVELTTGPVDTATANSYIWFRYDAKTDRDLDLADSIEVTLDTILFNSGMTSAGNVFFYSSVSETIDKTRTEDLVDASLNPTFSDLDGVNYLYIVVRESYIPTIDSLQMTSTACNVVSPAVEIPLDQIPDVPPICESKFRPIMSPSGLGQLSFDVTDDNDTVWTIFAFDDVTDTSNNLLQSVRLEVHHLPSGSNVTDHDSSLFVTNSTVGERTDWSLVYSRASNLNASTPWSTFSVHPVAGKPPGPWQNVDTGFVTAPLYVGALKSELEKSNKEIYLRIQDNPCTTGSVWPLELPSVTAVGGDYCSLPWDVRAEVKYRSTELSDRIVESFDIELFFDFYGFSDAEFRALSQHTYPGGATEDMKFGGKMMYGAYEKALFDFSGESFVTAGVRGAKWNESKKTWEGVLKIFGTNDFPNLFEVGGGPVLPLYIDVYNRNPFTDAICQTISLEILDSEREREYLAFQEEAPEPPGTCSRGIELDWYNSQLYLDTTLREYTFRDNSSGFIEQYDETNTVLDITDTVRWTFFVSPFAPSDQFTNWQTAVPGSSLSDRLSVGVINPLWSADELNDGTVPKWISVRDVYVKRGQAATVRFGALFGSQYPDGSDLSFRTTVIGEEPVSVLSRDDVWIMVRIQAYRKDPRDEITGNCGLPTYAHLQLEKLGPEEGLPLESNLLNFAYATFARDDGTDGLKLQASSTTVLSNPDWFVTEAFWEVVNEPDRSRPLKGWEPPSAPSSFSALPLWLRALQRIDNANNVKVPRSPDGGADPTDGLFSQLMQYAQVEYNLANWNLNLNRFQDGTSVEWNFVGDGDPREAHLRLYVVYRDLRVGTLDPEYIQIWEASIDFTDSRDQWIVRSNTSPIPLRALSQGLQYEYVYD